MRSIIILLLSSTLAFALEPNQILALHQAIAAVCPIDGVAILEDSKTWRIDYQASATAAQRAQCEQIAANFVLPPPTWQVPTVIVVQRLQAAGLLSAADAVLNQNVLMHATFYTMGTIASDDVNAIAFLKSIGADPAVILARP